VSRPPIFPFSEHPQEIAENQANFKLWNYRETIAKLRAKKTPTITLRDKYPSAAQKSVDRRPAQTFFDLGSFAEE
jgi:hypothetical protein